MQAEIDRLRAANAELAKACRIALDAFGDEVMSETMSADEARRFDAILHLTTALAAAAEATAPPSPSGSESAVPS